MLVCISFSTAQNIADASIKATVTKDFRPYLFAGTIVLDTAAGDFNSDGMTDFVIVSEDSIDKEKSRSLLILSGTKDGYSISSKCAAALLCEGCGGVFGDPYAGIDLNKNVLNLYNYGGSNWKWSSNYTFRFQNNQWELIGMSHDSYFSAEDCEGKGVGFAGQNLKEINFSTKKIHVIETEGTNCKPKINKWHAVKSFKKIILNNFNVEEDLFASIKY